MSAQKTRINHGRAFSPLFREIMSIPLGGERMFWGLEATSVWNVKRSLRKYGAETRVKTTSEGVRVVRAVPQVSVDHLKGTTFERGTGKWRAQISVHDRVKFLGRFATEAAAHQAYLAAKQEITGMING